MSGRDQDYSAGLTPGAICYADPPRMQITKREYFAAMAMQGLLSSVALDRSIARAGIAETALKHADELLAELEKPR